ncbi:hypothetical protein BD779DRAFT_21479 [Infundibulicybe gibba]|nr:hypothetical protein BD779DRAFT_21479 [Infundibulicybe gibba]
MKMQVLQEFDVQAFLETPLPGSPPHAPCPELVPGSTFLSSLSAVRYELHWSNDEAATCIVIVPTHRYNAKLYDGYGAWESVSSQEPGETRDLFWRNGGWCYLGEYECTQVKSISIQQVKNMGSSIENSLYKRTILFPDLVPVFFQNMVEGMYSAGVLRVNCVALKYVGFNAKLDNFLGHIQGNHIPIAIPGEKKRKTAPDVDDGRRQKGW